MIPEDKYVPSHLMYRITGSYNAVRDAFGFDANVPDEWPKVHRSWAGRNEHGTVAVWSWKEPIDPAENPDIEIEWSVWSDNPEAFREFMQNCGIR